ncbi:MAG TPA: hypothetical protein VGR87_10905 [Candidatus Limnocylindria bacterium]|nr:hypothetical protein [Candidatus Limnocylindria bacterium]
MPSWALRLLATAISGLVMLGSSSYVLANPFNAEAPLKPPLVKDPQPAATPTPTPSPTTSPSPSPTRPATPTRSASPAAQASATPAPTLRTPAPTLRPTPRPTLVLTAGVKMTAVPKVTLTHSS